MSYYWIPYSIVFVLVTLLLFKIYQKLTCGIFKTDVRLTGKVAIVTGANGGIGFETAKDLARRGAKVILACRSEGRGTEAQSRIVRETKNEQVFYKNLDLASLESVRVFAQDVLDTEKRLDILINNAGAMALGNRKTQDGIITEMQVNHFGPFLLTNLLLPLLKKSAPSRIVIVSSVGHHFGRVDLEKINIEGYYRDFFLYCNSKLCNVLFSDELSRRLRDTGVTSNSLHPGMVHTEVWRNTGFITRTGHALMNRMFYKNSWEGAQTSLYCAAAPECEGVSGKYFADCRVAWKSIKARDQVLAAKLWKYSENAVGIVK